MAGRKVVTTKKRADIISKSAQGLPLRTIARETGVSHVTVIREQKQLRPQVEAEMERLLTEGLSVSRATMVKFASYGATKECIPGESDPQWSKISLDAAKTIVNIPLQSAANSTNIVNQLININLNPELSKEAKAISDFISSQVIDV
jgi:hypothetical protein